MPSLRLVLAVTVGLGLVTAGFASAAQAHRWNQQCHEQWDDVEGAYADCEDFLYVAMLYGGALVGALGVALLGGAGWNHRSSTGE